jgi:hypothetical protein
MKTYWLIDVEIHVFLTSPLAEDECSALRNGLLYPLGKSPMYPLDRRLGGFQSRSGRQGEVNILDPSGTRTRTPRSSRSQFAMLTALSLPNNIKIQS